MSGSSNFDDEEEEVEEEITLVATNCDGRAKPVLTAPSLLATAPKESIRGSLTLLKPTCVVQNKERGTNTLRNCSGRTIITIFSSNFLHTTIFFCIFKDLESSRCVDTSAYTHMSYLWSTKRIERRVVGEVVKVPRMS